MLVPLSRLNFWRPKELPTITQVALFRCPLSNRHSFNVGFVVQLRRRVQLHTTHFLELVDITRLDNSAMFQTQNLGRMFCRDVVREGLSLLSQLCTP